MTRYITKLFSLLAAAAIAVQPAAAFSCACPCASSSRSNDEAPLEDTASSPEQPCGCCHKTAVSERPGDAKAASARFVPLLEKHLCRCGPSCECAARGPAPPAPPAVTPTPRLGLENFALEAASAPVCPENIADEVRSSWSDGASSFVLSAPRRCTTLCRWLL